MEYIDLTLIKRDKKPLNELMANKNIKGLKQGQIEEFQGRIKELNNIMSFEGRVCLIYGAPGVGKTRLSLKLTKEWAIGTLFKNFHLVLHVPLRHPLARLATNLDELMKYFNEENYNDKDMALIQEKEGNGVLFILDGWDELRPSCRDGDQFFPKLIAGEILPGCKVVVTSRPGLIKDIRDDAHQLIEVLGFGKGEVDKYILEYFKTDSDGGVKLAKDLQNYPSVASACYVAVNLAIVCHVYHALNYNLPETLTEVYKWFTIHTILHYLNKKKSNEIPEVWHTDDVFGSNLPSEALIFKAPIMDTLKQLGSLALKGLEENKLCFHRCDLEAACKLSSNDHQFDGFGLLRIEHIHHMCGVKPYYHFLHLSIQEFIAAYYINKLEDLERKKWLKDDFMFDATVKFFCGFDRFNSKQLCSFIRDTKKLRIFHFECVYEGQWKSCCEIIAGRCSNTYEVDHQCGALQPQQWEALGYVLANSKVQWHLKCSRFLAARNLDIFRGKLSGKCLSHLTLNKLQVDDSTMKSLLNICRSEEMLMELTLNDCVISTTGISTLEEAMKNHGGKLNSDERTKNQLLGKQFFFIFNSLLV